MIRRFTRVAQIAWSVFFVLVTLGFLVVFALTLALGLGIPRLEETESVRAIDRAEGHEIAGNLAAARAEYRRALRWRPFDVAARENYERIDRRMKSLEAAHRFADLLARVRDALEEPRAAPERRREIRDELASAVRRVFEFSEGRYWLGRLEDSLGRREEALGEYRWADRLDADSPFPGAAARLEAHERLEAWLLGSGAPPSDDPELDPNYREGLRLHAEFHDRPDASIELLDEAIERLGRPPELLLERGAVLAGRGRSGGRDRADAVDAYLTRASLRDATGERGEARRAVETATEVDPRRADAWRARARLSTGPEADAAAARARALDPDPVRNATLDLELAIARKTYGPAMRACEALPEAVREERSIRKLEAQILVRSCHGDPDPGRLDRAIEILERLEREDPLDVETLGWLATAHQRRSRFARSAREALEAARRYHERALAIDPFDVRNRHRLALVLAKRHEVERALDETYLAMRYAPFDGAQRERSRQLVAAIRASQKPGGFGPPDLP